MFPGSTAQQNRHHHDQYDHDTHQHDPVRGTDLGDLLNFGRGGNLKREGCGINVIGRKCRLAESRAHESQSKADDDDRDRLKYPRRFSHLGRKYIMSLNLLF
jgi:hypothetical protein